MKHKVIIFDKDGTLLDSAEGVLNSANYALAELGLSFPEQIDPYSIVGPPLKYNYREIFKVSENRLDEALALHRQYYGEHGLYQAKLYPGARELLASLHAAGVTLCIATSKFHLLAAKMLDHFGLAPFIQHAEMSDGNEINSSKTAMLERLLKRCNVPAQEAVMVGDTRYDAEAARQTGMDFIGVLYGYGREEDMRAAGATVFARTVPDLKKLLAGDDYRLPLQD